MLEVEPTGQPDRAASGSGRMATKLSPVLFQKHSPDGCTVDRAPTNSRRRDISFHRAKPCFTASC